MTKKDFVAYLENHRDIPEVESTLKMIREIMETDADADADADCR